MYLLPLSSSEKYVHTCWTCLEQCHIAVLVLKSEEFIFMSVCHLLSCISMTPSPWPFHLHLWSWPAPPQVSASNTHACMHACVHSLFSCCICGGWALCAAVQDLSEATLLDNVAKKQECVKVLDCPQLSSCWHEGEEPWRAVITP